MSEDSPEYVIPTYLYRKIDKLQRDYAELKQENKTLQQRNYLLKSLLIKDLRNEKLIREWGDGK